jgi:hypothetical protein
MFSEVKIPSGIADFCCCCCSLLTSRWCVRVSARYRYTTIRIQTLQKMAKTVGEKDASEMSKGGSNIATNDDPSTTSAMTNVVSFTGSSLSSTDIADALCTSLERHIPAGVQTLPIVSTSTELTTALVQLLLKKYRQAADLVQFYCRRNVESLAMYAPVARRRAIQAAFAQEESEPGSFLEKVEATNGVDASAAVGDDMEQCPPSHEIPSVAQVQELEGETHTLRLRLQALVKQKERTVQQVQQLDAAADLMRLARQRAPLQDIDTTAVTTNVQDTVSTLASLDDLHGKATELRAVMDERTKTRDAKLDALYTVASCKKRKPLSDHSAAHGENDNENKRQVVVTAAGLQKFKSALLG